MPVGVFKKVRYTKNQTKSMNKLIILAHPSKFGFARKASELYSEASKTAGHSVVTLDLYKEPRQDFLTFEHVKDITPDELKTHYQAEISKADELAFFFPLWWVEAPAILKNFTDNNFSAGFAYKYSKHRPVGLLKGKTAKFFITCDGPLCLYFLIAVPFRMIWQNMIMRFCGIRTTNFVVFDQMRKRNQLYKDKALARIKKLAS